MKYSAFRDPTLAAGLIEAIGSLVHEETTLMEVCGTHTMAISQFGIRGLMPEGLRLLSGPGCPVCVTPIQVIDMAIELAKQPSVLVTTFGDMMRVPGSRSSLDRERSDGRDVQIVYSPLDALAIARERPPTSVVFVGVGFETTSPTVASTVKAAAEEGVENFFVLPAFKLIPPAMRALVESGEVKVDGFICPGHVSVIIGSEPYRFLSEEFGIPCVVTGFEPLDILQGISMLLRQIERGEPTVEIQYRRGVKPEGNEVARSLLQEVFDICDAGWRGIGTIPLSGHRFKERYGRFDAVGRFAIDVSEAAEPDGCRCGEMMRGVATPPDCAFFGTRCTPSHPVGPCMVSSEGVCAAYYRYGGATS